MLFAEPEPSAAVSGPRDGAVRRTRPDHRRRPVRAFVVIPSAFTAACRPLAPAPHSSLIPDASKSITRLLRVKHDVRRLGSGWSLSLPGHLHTTAAPTPPRESRQDTNRLLPSEEKPRTTWMCCSRQPPAAIWGRCTSEARAIACCGHAAARKGCPKGLPAVLHDLEPTPSLTA